MLNDINTSSYHTPIMLPQVLSLLRPERGGTYVDGTLGGGGHSLGILRSLPAGGRLFGIDRDGEAIAAASARLSVFPNFTAVRGNFFQLTELLNARGVNGADGILLATPDGSTAYSMSAGGPVLDTTLNAIIMTPVCPHSLISRSIVFSPDKVISVGSKFSGGERKLDVVVDGEIAFCIKKNEKITVSASEKCVRFVNISGRGFYEVLNQKIIGRR